jgi:hypothetical protein
VQFNADVADGMPWKFVPTQREVLPLTLSLSLSLYIYIYIYIYIICAKTNNLIKQLFYFRNINIKNKLAVRRLPVTLILEYIHVCVCEQISSFCC